MSEGRRGWATSRTRARATALARPPWRRTTRARRRGRTGVGAGRCRGVGHAAGEPRPVAVGTCGRSGRDNLVPHSRYPGPGRAEARPEGEWGATLIAAAAVGGGRSRLVHGTASSALGAPRSGSARVPEGSDGAGAVRPHGPSGRSATQVNAASVLRVTPRSGHLRLEAARHELTPHRSSPGRAAGLPRPSPGWAFLPSSAHAHASCLLAHRRAARYRPSSHGLGEHRIR